MRAGLLVILALVAGCRVPPAPGTSSDDDLLIAYNVLVSERDDYEIFVMNLDGSEPRNISSSDGTDWVYASLGDTLYFVSTRDVEGKGYHLFSMKSDGSDVRRLAGFLVPDSYVSARDMGRELAISRTVDGQTDLYLIDPAGTVLRRLTDRPMPDRDPAFSPGGSLVAFRAGTMSDHDLWIVERAGGEPKRLTFYPDGKSRPDEHVYRAGPPRWSPSGSLISFISHQDGNYDIWLVRPDGSGLKRLTETPFDEGWHDWSPDGKRIVLDATKGEGYDIYMMDAHGAGMTRLTSSPDTEQSPVFVRRAGR